ncbi:MAG: hypothetical protein IKN54_05850 [Lachnospiraceae bacterium]|nr:hypothetical protein [Lachnospiraceae bacterium]
MASSNVLKIEVGSTNVTSGSTVTGTGAAGTTWSIPATNFTEGEVTTITFTVKDSAGKETKKTISACKDTTAPEIEITSPADNDFFTGDTDQSGQLTGQLTVKANGSVNETGIGMVAGNFKYSTDNTNWTGFTSYAGGSYWNQNLVLNEEGSVTLYIKAEDKLGNATTTPEQVTFSFDKDVPQIAKIHGTLHQYYKAGDTVTLRGTAYDTNLLSKIEITDTLNGIGTTYSTANANEITIESGAIATAKSAATKVTWSKSFTFAENGNRDGQHTITIVATDDAGRKSTITESFVVDTRAPTFTEADITPPSVYETASATSSFSGSSTDNVEGINVVSGVAQIKVKYVDGTNESAERVVNGTTTWFDSITFNNITKSGDASTKIFETSGEKKIKVKAIDAAGNETDWIEKSFNYDTQYPAVALASYKVATTNAAPYTYGSDNATTTDFAVSKAFQMSGTLSDDWGIPATGAVTIKQRKGASNATEVELSGIDYTYNQSTKTWTISGLPRDPEAPANTDVRTSEYFYTIYATDNAGKESSKTIKVTVDNKAPTVTFNNPSTNLEATTSAAISGSMYNFKVEARDQDNGDVGLASYSYAFTDSTAVPSSWTTVNNVSDGEFTIGRNLVSGTNRSGLTSEQLCEGQWFLHFKAKDKAGNESTDAYRSFYIDLTAPSLTTTVTTGSTVIENSNTYFFKNAITGTTVATDSYAMAASNAVTYKIGETTVTPTTTTTDGVTTWSIASSNAAFNGTYQTLTITATDSIGRTTIKTYNIYKDETAPTLSITQPAANANIDQSPVHAVVSVTENGVGIKGMVGEPGQSGYEASKLEYRFKNSAEWGDWTPTNYVSGTIAQTDLELGSNQGEMFLQYRVEDKLGNSTETSELKFYYDYENPVVTRTDTTTTYQNSAFTLSGKAYDTYKLARVEISDDYGTGTVYSSAAAAPTVTITGNINNAVSSTTAVDWSKTFATTGTGALAEGNHNFKVTAYDVSGRSMSTQTKNVFVDVTGPVVNTIVVPTTDLTEGDSYKFNGTAQDAHNDSTLDSGIKKIEIQITNEGESASDTESSHATGWIEASGLTSWNATIVFNASTHPVFSTEGVKTVHVRAIDEAGNVGEATTKNFVFDKAAPTLAITHYIPAGGSELALSQTDTTLEFKASSNFALKGSASDGNLLKTIVITQKIGDGDEVEIENRTINGTEHPWTIGTGLSADDAALPRNPATPSVAYANADIPSGEYTYTITVTDAAGADNADPAIPEATAKTTTKTVKATIDKTAPQIESITNPSSASSNTGLNSISVVSFTFRGTAADNVGGNSGQTGLAAVWYKIIEDTRDLDQNGQTISTTTPPAAPTANTTQDSAWTGLGFTRASNTTNWFFSQAFKAKGATGDGLEEGQYKVVVYAVDAAGNVSSAASQIFDVDMAAPEIETKLDNTVLAESMTQTKTGAYEFKYKVTESYGLAANNPVVTIRKDNEALTSGTDFTEAVSGDYKVITITDHEDGLYEYTISATDLVGKNSTIRRNILLDTTPPTLTVTSPDLLGYQNSTSVKVNGSSEDKSGTEAVWYSFGAASMPAKPTSNTKADASWTGNGWTKATGTTSWSFTVNGVEGTDKNLYIAAVDTNGAVTTTGAISAVVMVDVTNPTLTETGIGAGTQYKKADYTLSGTVSDTGSGLPATNAVAITVGETTYHPTVTDGDWSQTIDTTSLTEAEYVYTITATDNAGRVSSLTRTVIFDKTAPSITTAEINDSSVASTNKASISNETWYKTTQIPVSIAGSDILAGLSYIECSTDYNPSNPTIGNWTTLSRSGNNYVGQVSCTAQGTNTIYVRATDQAGNTSTPVAPTTLKPKVDTLAPTTLTLTGGASATGVNLKHGRNDITFTFTVVDNENGCGLAPQTGDDNNKKGVVLTALGNGLISGSIAATTTSNENEYSITIPSDQLPTTENTPISVVITARDGLGQATTFSAFQLQMDNTYPSAIVNAIDDADKSTTGVTEVNGTITVSGTTSDTNTITAVKLQYQTSANGTSGWSDWADYTASERQGTLYNWNYSIDTTASPFSDNTYVRFRAVATDRAGNTGNSGVTDSTTPGDGAYGASNYEQVLISQYTDRPVIKFTNLKFDNLFDNDNTNNTIWLKNSNTLYGLVSDDDGDVLELWFRNPRTPTAEKPNNAYSWKQLYPLAGSGYFEIKDETDENDNTIEIIGDGENTIYFKVKDKAGNEFVTNVTASTLAHTLAEPIISDGVTNHNLDGTGADGTTAGSGTVELTLKVDKTSPVIQNAKFQIYNTDLATPAWGSFVMDDETHALVWTSGETAWSTSLPTLGGKYTKFKMKLEAKDQNGVQSVTSTFNSGTPSFTCAVANPVADDQWHEWATGEIAVPNNETQVMPFAITITDGAGLTKLESVQVEVDNSAPEITITEPSSLIGTNETMRGNISTTNADESRETKLYYAVSRAPQPVDPEDEEEEEQLASYDPTEDYKPLDTGYIRYDTTDTTKVIATRWTEIQGLTTQLNWFVYFDDGTGTDHTNRFAKYLTENYLGYTTNADLTNNIYNNITYVYFWIRAIDSTGNTSYAYKRLKIDPQGDRPQASIVYPANNSDGSVPILGGSIRVSGTATDNELAKYVWLQIDKNNDGTFDKADLAFLNTVDENDSTKRKYNYKLGKISTNTEMTRTQINTIVTNESITDVTDYGIMVTVQGGSSWFVNINEQNEYSPQTGSTNTLKLIAYATDETNNNDGTKKINKSLPVQQVIKLNSDNPIFRQVSLKLVQYETSSGSGVACTDGSVSTGNVANTMDYTDGMSIKGIWFLTGEVYHREGIKSIQIDGGVSKIASAGSDYIGTGTDAGIRLEHAAIEEYPNNYKFQIPIGNNTPDAVGSISKEIKATANTDVNPSSQKTFTVKYDNKAPVIKTSGTNVTLNTSIADSSGFFTFGAVASEDNVNNVAQSGVERIAFYFTRDMDYNIQDIDDENNPIYGSHSETATETHDLFDVMIKNENRDTLDPASGNMIIDYATTGTFDTNTGVFTPTGGIKSGYVYEDGLIWQQVTGATISLNSVTLTSVGKNVHKGGLAKINGAFYKITGTTTTSVTLSGNPGDTTNGTILFAVANIVDISDKVGSDQLGSSNNGYETYGFGYYVNNSADDGDLMIESFNKTGTDWIWDATIKSTNLPDGPITLHIVAIDGAGNTASYAYTATVQNNGPRIAGIKIGNDENGNNVIDNEEFISDYSGFYVNGKRGNQEMHTVTLPESTTDPNTGAQIINSAIKAKGLVEIQPEIVGGNGALNYTYSAYKRNENGWNATAAYNMNTPTSLGTGRPVSADDNNPVYAELNMDESLGRRKGIILTVADFVQHNLSGEKDKFTFTIGDNTPAATNGGNPQSATLNVIMDVVVGDNNAAKNYIIPFYWKKKPNTSNEVVSSLFRDSRDYGHIELPNDWVHSSFYRPYDENDTGDTLHLLDQDPKVSGKIKIEGIAQDDVLLKDITLKFNKKFGGTGGFAVDTELTIASYNNGIWTVNSALEEDTAITATNPISDTNPLTEQNGKINATKGWSAEITQATYGDLIAAHIIDELPTIGNTTVRVNETDSVPYASQNYGHVVHWTLYLDTAKLSTIAATEVTLEATATDRGNPTWNGSSVVYTPNDAEVTTSTQNTGYTGAVTTSGTGNSMTVTTNAYYTGKLKMDIVPYITKVTTALVGKLKSSIKAAYSRTALGHYIARSTENITITGFSLGDNGTYKPNYGSTALTGSDGTSVSLAVSNITTSGEIALTVNSVETLNNKNNNNSSGTTEAITEASLYAKKDAYAYNRMPNRTSNNLLTDDVVIDVWEFDSDAAKPRSGELREPIMRINPVTGKVGLAFVSGPGDFAMAGNTSTNGVNTNGFGSNNSINENSDPGTKNIYSYSLWQNNYATFNNISFAFDANGYAHATTSGLDTNPGAGTKHVGRFSYFYNRWGRSGTSTGANYDGAKAIRLESLAVPEAPRRTGFTINGNTNMKLLVKGQIPDNDALSETRFYSPSIVTTVNGNDTSVYLAYYDSIQGQIRFRYNSSVNATFVGGGTNGNSNEISAERKARQANDKDQFVDNLVRINKTATNDSTTVGDYDVYMATKNNSGNSTNPSVDYEIYYEPKTDYFSLIAGVDYQQGTLRTQDDVGTSGRCLTGYDTGYAAYKYVCIDAIPKSSFTPAKANDIVVAVWYTGEKLMYAYNDNPTSGLDNGTAGGWKGNKVIFADGGEHCAVKVDPLGGIHIAAYVDGSLRYAYLSSYDDSTYVENYDSPTTNKAVIVDSFTITGERITIDAGLTQVPGTSTYVVIPYISYFNGTARLPAVAHPVIKSSMNYAAQGTGTNDGDDIFTGDWEVSLVPSPKTVTTNYYDKINLGLWKRAAANNTEPKGMIVENTDSKFTGTARNNTSANNDSQNNYGHIYGNGTKNPIMGYVIESATGTILETAQMR